MTAFRQYLASSLDEATARIKSDMGGDAVILGTRTVRRGPLWGLFSPPLVEVTVAEPPPGQDTAQALSIEAMRRDMEAVRAMVGELQQNQPAPRFPPPYRELYAALRRRGVPENLAQQLTRKAQGNGKVHGAEAARHRMQEQVQRGLGPVEPLAAAPGAGRRVALVGPAGAGKTTALAKLATQFTLERHLRVGILGTDTRRLGADAQLRAFCQVLGTPLALADGPAAIAAALQELAGCDLVLCDTAGIGPRDAGGLAGLHDLLAALAPDDCCLVLSLTTAEADAEAVVAAYAPLRCTRLVATRYDETSRPGLLLHLRAASGLPLSYVSTGPGVPGDLEPLDPAAYCRLLLDGGGSTGKEAGRL